MNAFWYYARRMLAYRRLLIAGFAAALLDAACAFGGFGALMWVIDRLFGADNLSVRELVRAKLDHPWIESNVGDLSHLAGWVPASAFGGFVFMLGVILVLAVIGGVMRCLHQVCTITAVLRTVMIVRKETFQRLIHAPLARVMVEGSADHLSRIVRDCSQLVRGLNALMAKAVRDVLVGSAALVWALLIDWRLSVLFLISAPVIYVCMRKFGKRIRRATKYALRAYGGMIGALQEAMQGMAVVKVHRAEGYERRRFNAINRRVYRQEMRARIARGVSSPVIELIAIAGVIGVALVAGWYVLRPGGGSADDMRNVLMMLGLAGAMFRPLANLNNDLQEASAAAHRIHEARAIPVEPDGLGAEAARGPDLPPHREQVCFEGVGYVYPAHDRPAIEGVDLQVEHGQTCAIVGPNGAGKSTLLSLLPRLLEPSAGRVRIDGHDIGSVRLRSLRGQMAMVPQQTVLFEGTIAENIAYGMRHCPFRAVEQAARAAHAHDFVVRLDQGYETSLGEGGVGLSGGQRQRLAIARAILRDPRILILDEATSQLDAESEASIGEVLKSFRRGRTTFVIAHRMTTVMEADWIVVMAEGGVVDQGAHEALIDRCEIYQMLARTQLSPAAAGAFSG